MSSLFSLLFFLLGGTAQTADHTATTPPQIVMAAERSCPAICEGTCLTTAPREQVCLSTRASLPLTISPSRIECVAPCGIQFEARLNNVRPTGRNFRATHFAWEFGDPGAVFENLAADFPFGRDANRAFGPFAAHVFEKPGTYRVRLDAIGDNDRWAQSDITVRVKDPARAFGASNTYCISVHGDFSGCPKGAQRHTDPVRAFSLATQAQRGWLLFRAGETVPPTDMLRVRHKGPYVISRFGEGADPVLELGVSDPSRLLMQQTDEVSISHLTFRGDYDPKTGMGASWRTSSIANFTFANHTTIWRTRHSGMSNAFLDLGGVAGMVIADNAITSWYNFGLWIVAGDRFGLVGNSILQEHGSVSGPGEKDFDKIPRWSDHGPIRTVDGRGLVMSRNDMRSLAGWSSGGKAHQPNIRYATGAAPGHSGLLSENRLTGGFTVASVGGGGPGQPSAPGDVLFERNLMIGTDNTHQFLGVLHSGATVRNNVMWMPEAETTLHPLSQFVVVQAVGDDAANKEHPILFLRNTLTTFQSRRGDVRLVEDRSREVLPYVVAGNFVTHGDVQEDQAPSLTELAEPFVTIDGRRLTAPYRATEGAYAPRLRK